MWLDTFNQMRKESGMSLDELCEKSGIPKGTLAKITSGVTKAPSLETMRSLVYAMGYRLKDLDDGLEFSDNFTKEERIHMQKYRSLDQHGKEAVVTILDCEIERMNRSQEVVELSPGIKVLKIAGRDGSFREIHLTEKQQDAFHAYLNQLQLQDASDIL